MKKKKETVNKKNRNVNENVETKKGFKLHFNFGMRVCICIVLSLVLFVSGTVMLKKALSLVREKSINYSEKSKLDYRVYLKENDFYEEDYLGKDMIYVASLIDKIDIDFGYSFSSDRDTSLNFTYDIVAKLVISDEKGNNSYFEKEYELLSDKTIVMEKEKYTALNETVDIDYNYYNRVANSFKTSYGVDTVSKLIVYLRIDKSNTTDESYVIPASNSMSITIPLSERALNIKLDYNEINNINTIVSKAKVVVDDVLYLVIAIVLLILCILPFLKSIKLLMLIRSNKNAYDKYMGKILNEYDRLIVETTSFPDLSDKTIIKINKFDELLDVRDNLKLPVMYYTVNKHQKCYLYIIHNERVYLLTIKAVDLE